MGIDFQSPEDMAEIMSTAGWFCLSLLFLIVGIVVGNWTLRRKVLRSTAELQQQAQQFSALLEGASDAIFVQTGDRFAYVNKAVCRLFGVERENLLCRKVVDIFHSAVKQSDAASIHKLNIQYEGEHPTEAVILKSDGTEMPVEYSAVPIRYEGKEGVLVFLREISQRKKIEKILNQERARFKQILDTFPFSIYIVNQEFIIEYVNQRFKNIFGDPGNKKCHDFLQGLPFPCPWCKKDQVFSGKYVCWELCHEKSKRDYEVHDIPLHNADGSISKIVVFHDITERKSIEQELREKEKLFRSMFEFHPAVQLLIDPHNRQIIDANLSAASFYGWNLDHLQAMKIDEINILSKEELSKEIRKAQKNEKFHFEFSHLRADRSIREVEVYTSLIQVGGRDLLHSIIHDVTQRKQIEAERERLLSAIEQAGEVILITDTDGVIQYVNPAFESVTGYSRSEAIGKRPSILKSGQHDQEHYENIWKTISGGAKWKGSMVNKRKDGTVYTEEATISPVRNTSGQIVNYVAVKRDISEHLLLESQLVQAQKMEAVGRLAGGVAHDFNNMLSVINGYAELLLERFEEHDPLRPLLQNIHAAGLRSSDLVRQLLAFARKQTIAPRVLDLNELIGSLLKMLHRLIGENVGLAWMSALGLWEVKMDPAQIDQILANLAVNARDSIVDVGKVTIETENVFLDPEYCAGRPGCTPGEYVLLAVSDTGCGMDEQTMERIFEPFFTTKGEGRGTGLGLSTVYGIVKQNNGYISVYSELGVGTTFKVYLQRYVTETKKISYKEQSGDIPRGQENILIVEDKPEVLITCKHLSESLGYNVLTAESPEDALQIVRDFPDEIHLLITDVVMPKMNGRALRDRIVELHPGIRSLFMSGYTANVIAHHGVLEEGIHFIEKPFTRQSLAVKIREVLDEGSG